MIVYNSIVSSSLLSRRSIVLGIRAFTVTTIGPTPRMCRDTNEHSIFVPRTTRRSSGNMMQLWAYSQNYNNRPFISRSSSSSPMRQRDDYYTIRDAFDANQQRPYPPALDSQYEDDGFGAYDYDDDGNNNQLDPYAQADVQKQQQQLIPYDSIPEEYVDESSFPDIPRPARNIQSNPTATLASNVQTPKNIPSNFSPSARKSRLNEPRTYKPSITIGKEPISPSFSPIVDPFASKAAYGSGVLTTNVYDMEVELVSLEQSIYEQNNGRVFNVNSPKQLADVLFGRGGGSTSKDVLEGMAAGGNRMAELVLKYRALKYQIVKITRRQESVAKGTAVQSASTVARAQKQVAVPSSNSGTNADDNTTSAVMLDDIVLQDENADPLLLLDASAFIFRAYYSMPPIHRSDGMPTGAVMGFCKMLNAMLLSRMLQGEEPRLVLCFDAKGKTFRHELYAKYKGNRPAAPMDLVPQFDLVRQAAKAYGICQIEAGTFEADDVIATLATRAIAEGVDVNILSGDKDLMQLVTELDATPSIQMIDPVKKDRTTYKQVVEKWEVPPSKLGDVLALSGDTADNVPGVRGIGPKTAAKLINEFDTLENLLANVDSIKQKGVRDKLQDSKSEARLSRILVELNRTVPLDMISGLPDGVDQMIGDLRMEPMDSDRILSFYDQMGFKELKRSFEYRLKGVKRTKRKSSSYGKSKATVPQPQDYSDVPF